MLFALMAAALWAQDPAPLDGDRLTELGRSARSAETFDLAWDGRRFAATVALTPLEEISVNAAHSPAVWTWSNQEQALYLIVGGSRLARGNYDQFAEQDLQRYPNVRPVFISVDEKLRKPLDPLDMMMRPSDVEDMARMMRMLPAGRSAIEHLTAFSVALVDLDPSEGAPTPLQERVVLRQPMSRREAEALVRDLKLTVEGRLENDGGPFCGAFNHRRGIVEPNDRRVVDLVDTQCFLPARIERMALVRGDGSVFAEWPGSAPD